MTETESAHPRVAVVGGFWGQNIGNAFFNVGGKWILDQVFGAGDVAFIQDQPGYRTFHRQSSGNPARDLGLLDHLDVDWLVLQGPMLTITFRSLWQRTFQRLRARGTKIILLSAGLSSYTQYEIEESRRFLAEFKPTILVTRDRRTFQAVSDIVDLSYDGIDSAFFAPRAFVPHRLALEPYIAVTFDRYPEPRITVASAADDLPQRATSKFEALGSHWGLEFPGLTSRIADRGWIKAYLASLMDRRRLPTHAGGRLIVRPEHRSNPHVGWKVYRHQNAVTSDEPFTYFTVYANADLTISDRVHACVASLAYGTPAMLLAQTGRASLFDRVDATEIGRRPVTLDRERLREEQDAEIEFLRRSVRPE
jgi:hypothetical protein